MDSFIGDEPKPLRPRGKSGRDEHPKVPSDLIKVLAKLSGYRPSDRLLFRKKMLAMLKSTGTTWLLRNEQREAPNRPASHRQPVFDTPFTPGPVHNSRRDPESKYGHSPQVHAHARSRTYGLDTHSRAYGLDTHSRTYGLDHAYAFGLDKQYSGIAHGHAASKPTPAFRQNVSIHSLPHHVGEHPSQISSVLPYVRTSLHNAATSDPWAIPAPTMTNRPANDDESVHSRPITRGSAQSHAGSVGPFPPAQQYPAQATPAFSRASRRAASIRSDDHASEVGRAPQSQGGPPSNQSNLTPENLANREMRNMAQAMNQSNVNNAAQLDQLASMFSQQKAMLENQNTEMQELRAQLAAQKVKGSSYAEGADGAEAWIADAILEADLAETHFWWHTIKQRWENEHESLLRSRIFSYITSLVPIEMYDQLADGDVRGIYINIIEMGTKEAAEQIVSLEAEIARLSKSGRPMAAWLNALYEIFSQLAILGQPRTVNQIRVMIYTNLASDQRYSNVVRDIKRNPQWSMVAIRGALEAEATSLNDLLPNQGHGVHTQEMRKKAHAAKRAKKAERYDSDSDNDDPPTYPDDTTTKPKKKALTGKAAHPGAKDKRTPKAEAPAKSASELRLLAEEPCLRFQTGACPFGDACYRKHITLNKGR